MRTGDKVEGRIADDCCLFCGSHFGPAGGHYYRGICNKDGNVITEEGGLIIPHLTNCSVQICPDCYGRIKTILDI